MSNKKKNIDDLTIEDEVQEYMQTTVDYLKEKYGEVKKEWYGALDMLATQYLIYLKCKETILKEGVMVMNARGVTDKHPLLKQLTDSQIQIVKLINEFGLSPKSHARIKVGGGQDTEADYIKSLMEGNEA